MSQDGVVQRTIAADTPAPPAKLFEVMSDLATYQRWMDLIERCEPAVADAGDEGPAWWVTLRAKVGPFARSKRLRMVRTEAEANSLTRFERRETDGRKHSDWVMTARIDPINTGSRVSVELSYTGGLWSGPLDAVLGSQVDSALPRLRAYVSA
jgi:uncharacterized protein YndB with AHSA1/START domain